MLKDMRKYNQLRQRERDQIDVLNRKGESCAAIGKKLKRDKSTIARELKRNSSPEYHCYLAHRASQRANERKHRAVHRERLRDPLVRAYVLAKLKEDWSPEQIAGRIRTDHPGLKVSHEAIYQYIYAKDTVDRKGLIASLKRSHRKRRHKGLYRHQKKTKIPNRVSIDQRPAQVQARRQFGHWETDSLISRKSKAALNSLTERKSRLLRLTGLRQKSARHTARAVIRHLKDLPPAARRTLTLDNGTENTGHELITLETDIQCYFAHPYHSWERGTNENTNGLIRYYLPKGTDFSTISKQQLQFIENRLNNRPRKCLGFKTPNEVAASCVALHG